MIDITAFGEVLIDYTPAGKSQSGMDLFEQNPGGAPANLLASAAKLGSKTAFIGKVGVDTQGRFLKKTLENAGIYTGGLVEDHRYFTTMAFVSLTESGERSFAFARKPGADTQMTVEEVDFSILKNSRILHFGSLSLTDSPSRETTLDVIKKGREAGCIISYDPNDRPLLWPSREAAREQMRRVLPFVDIMKLSDEETELLTDMKTPEEAAKVLLEKGIRLVAVTLGKEGAYVTMEGKQVWVPGYEVDAVDTTGAGDAFWGAFLYKLNEKLEWKTGNWDEIGLGDLEELALFANAAAACCVTKRGGIPAMPTLQEIEKQLEGRSKNEDHSEYHQL